VFGNQRRRWLSAQFHYFRRDFEQRFNFEGNIDYFDKTIQFILPPRILLLGAVVLLELVFLQLSLNNQIPYTNCWITLVACCVLSFVFSAKIIL
jgi:hypothetical protein